MFPAGSTSPPGPVKTRRSAGTADSSPPSARRMSAVICDCTDRAGSVGPVVSDTLLPPLAALVLPAAGRQQGGPGQSLGQGVQVAERLVQRGQFGTRRPLGFPLNVALLAFDGVELGR